jgi:hypothetical protein
MCQIGYIKSDVTWRELRIYAIIIKVDDCGGYGKIDVAEWRMADCQSLN